MTMKRTLRAAQVLEINKKPMARARRASLFQRQVRVSLSSTAAALLVARAQVLSEGQIEHGRFYGSTMMSLDLRRLEDEVSDEVSAETANRFGALAAADPELLAHTRALGIAEAKRLAGSPIGEPQLDVRIRARGPHIQIDIDIEADLGNDTPMPTTRTRRPTRRSS